MMLRVRRTLVLLVGAVALVLFTMAFRVKRGSELHTVYTTLGEVQAVHAGVSVSGREVRGVQRFGANDRLTTDRAGRARARLDDGTNLVIDRATTVRVVDKGAVLEEGRLFVQGAAGARTEVTASDVTVLVGAATVAVDRTDATHFYCVSGEVVVRGPGAGKEVRVRSGETARVSGAEVVVAPEKAFNDWTGGMAHPWSAGGKARGVIGELWGRAADSPDDTGTPLAVRSHDVQVTLVGEVATTEARTTYFNAGSRAVVGDFRMALPRDAIVSGFAVGSGDALHEAAVLLASDTAGDPDSARLEWAGEGWLRGRTRRIPPGQTAVVVVRYVEWLSPAGGRMAYRYPMLGEGAPPQIGEFHARIDAAGVDATAIGIGTEMHVEGDVIEVRRADLRPTSDLVVDFQLRPGSLEGARGYFVPDTEDAAGSYLLVRSEVSPRSVPAGITLALVVDTSRSVTPSSLDAERAVVLALLDGLGPEDEVVVFAADDHARPVGPGTLGPVDDARRAATRRALSDLRPGGATDLGASLEQAADALPPDVPSATLLYLGDGWPTLGDRTVDAIRTRLARRRGGLPRLGAVAAGAMSNRSGLTALVRGAGPVFAVDDATSAAEVAVQLLAEALKPAIAGAELDLGADAERVYPRGGRTLRDGDTITTVARMRSPPPRTVTLRYRDGADERKDVCALLVLPVADGGDVRRRWSAGRVEELMLRGGGREAVVDAALHNELLTPWTGWAVQAGAEPTFRATDLWSRVLDAGLEGGIAVFSAGFTTPRPPPGALRPPTDAPWPKVARDGQIEAWKVAATAAAQRKLDEALGLVRQCRESRATLRPEVGGALRVELALGADGHVVRVGARGRSALDDDAALDRCVEVVIRNLSFPETGGGATVSVSYEFHLPPARDARARVCSPTSALPAPLRRGVWFERLHRPESERNPLGIRGERAYLRAKATCEMPSWSDRRTFLELLLQRAPGGVARVELARLLDEGGDADAAEIVRREAIRRAESPAELDAIRSLLLANEPDVSLPFVAAYAKAETNEARLTTVQRFLRLAPHDSRLRRKELALLLALGKKDELLSSSVRVRAEPFLDVSLLGDTASTLLQIGADDEARRTFGELAERAPQIPFARAFLGDRLRDEGLYDDATTAYEALLSLVPDDPAATFRLALANAGAGRLDLASRQLAHVAETGGRTSDGALEELAGMTRAVLVAEARAAHPAPADEERLHRRALEIPAPDAFGFALVRAPTWVPGLRVVVTRGMGEETLTPVLAAPLGLAGLRIERGEGPLRFRLSRQNDLEPSPPATARVQILVTDGHADSTHLVTKDVPLRTDGTDTSVVWDGTSLL